MFYLGLVIGIIIGLITGLLITKEGLFKVGSLFKNLNLCSNNKTIKLKQSGNNNQQSAENIYNSKKDKNKK